MHRQSSRGKHSPKNSSKLIVFPRFHTPEKLAVGVTDTAPAVGVGTGPEDAEFEVLPSFVGLHHKRSTLIYRTGTFHEGTVISALKLTLHCGVIWSFLFFLFFHA